MPANRTELAEAYGAAMKRAIAHDTDATPPNDKKGVFGVGAVGRIT